MGLAWSSLPARLYILAACRNRLGSTWDIVRKRCQTFLAGFAEFPFAALRSERSVRPEVLSRLFFAASDTASTNEALRVRGTPGMIELEQEDPIPQGDLALQITALPRETNGFGDIFGGWLVAQMDLAGTAMASRVAGGRVATVAIDRMAFLVPVAVGAQLSFYTQTLEIGRSSIQMMVEVWSDDPLSSEWRKVTEAVFVFVAIDGSGRTRSVPPRR